MRAWLLAAMCIAAVTGAARAEGLRMLGAGSLREVIGEIGARYKAATGVEVTGDFGPSGLVRERIEKGEKADLFASADMGHPLKLLADGKATRVAMFTRNALCGFAGPKLGLTTATFLDNLLDPVVKLGTSTPKADPSGDYTWLMFRRADALRPGAYATLDAKAQKIVGGPTTPTTGNPAAEGLTAGTVHVMIGYCSGAKRMQAAVADVQMIQIPTEIAAGPEYGLAVIKGADPRAGDLALYMLSPEGQQVFAQFGFAPIGLPAPEPK
jgi:molybdenum ABC transporter molybdate-binding protein